MWKFAQHYLNAQLDQLKSHLGGPSALQLIVRLHVMISAAFAYRCEGQQSASKRPSRKPAQ